MHNRTRLNLALFFALLATGLILVLVFADFEGATEEEEEAFSFPEAADSVFPGLSISDITGISVIDEASGKEWAISREFDSEGNPGDWSLEASPDDDLEHLLDQEQIDTALIALIGLSPTRTLADVEDFGEFNLADDEALLITLSDPESNHSLRVGGMNVDASDYFTVVPGEHDVMLLPVYQMEPLVTFVETPPYLDDLIEAMESEG